MDARWIGGGGGGLGGGGGGGGGAPSSFQQVLDQFIIHPGRFERSAAILRLQTLYTTSSVSV